MVSMVLAFKRECLAFDVRYKQRYVAFGCYMAPTVWVIAFLEIKDCGSDLFVSRCYVITALQ